MKHIFCLILLCFWTLPVFATPKIAYINNGTEKQTLNNPFWNNVQLFLVASAESLGVELKTYYSGFETVKLRQQIIDITTKPEHQADVILFQNFRESGVQIIELAEKHNVKSFVFNAGMDRKETGLPREQYKHWIGELLPDDVQAGKLLAKTLFEAASGIKKRASDGKIHMVGVQGMGGSPANIARKKGLAEALQNNPHVLNQQIVLGRWSESAVKTMFPSIIKRYPETMLFWSASDGMAFGILEAAKEKGWKPGKDFITGGIDLSPRAFEAVQANELVTTIGGHYVESAMALILIYDYLNGHDFASEGSAALKSQMTAITAQNIKDYPNLGKKLTLENIKQIDFKKFSKVHNSNLKEYVLHSDQYLKEL